LIEIVWEWYQWFPQRVVACADFELSGLLVDDDTDISAQRVQAYVYFEFASIFSAAELIIGRCNGITTTRIRLRCW